MRYRKAEGSEGRLADLARSRIHDRFQSVGPRALRGGIVCAFERNIAEQSVLLATRSQILSAVALIELDGRARRIVVAPPDIRIEHIGHIVADAGIDCIVTDQPEHFAGIGRATVLSIGLHEAAQPAPYQYDVNTEWVLLTSGTSGRPKMVVHSLSSLTGAIPRRPDKGSQDVWSTFYDIRRFGGLQIFLRAVLGGSDLVLTGPDEHIDQQLLRLAKAGVTSISGTPSHWRRVLMSQNRRCFAPSYIRLSGEISDQMLLDSLKSAFPNARVSHAYASTEAGVGFAVDDGREGFPAALVGEPLDGVEMKVVDGGLHIRSSRTATRYVASSAAPLVDTDGFVDTSDLVERRGDRYFFIGRRNGIINVGGLKVSPEEVETVLNGHAAVQVSRVVGRRNAVTGAIIVADVVPRAASMDEDTLRREIMAHCQQRLERHKTPAVIRFVDSLGLSAAGKLKREAVAD